MRPVERIPTRGSAFREAPCWLVPSSAYTIDCGVVTTSSHDGADDRAVELAVAVVYSNGAQVAKEPVVFLDGGPGAASLAGLLGGSIPFTSVLDDHDLVLFDQRGTGFSKPKPACDVSNSAISAGGPGTADAGLSRARDGGAAEVDSLLARCRDRAAADGLDLSMFHSAENAADAVAVQHALGYEKWSLYGISYGTRYALTVLRDHPAGVGSVVIDSVVPLQIDLIAGQGASLYRAIHLIAAACSQQSSCGSTYGDIESKELAALTHLAETPPSVTLDDGTSAVVPAALVANLFVTFMYSTETIAYLPELVQEVSDEDYTVFSTLLSSERSGASAIDTATYLSTTCADEVPFSSPDALSSALDGVPEPWRKWLSPSSLFDVCRTWNVPPSPSRENAAVKSAVPALVMSGEFDPVTPPSYGALAATTLSRSQNLVFPTEAHGSSLGGCGKRAVHAFLNDPIASIDSSCRGNPSLSFQSLNADARRGAPALTFDTSRNRVPAALIASLRRRFPMPAW
jgi:pimeloyl-ACP methyl ester carboxylesterase